MKKKIITSILMLVIILMALATNVFAANYSNSYYNSYIPYGYELTYENEENDHIYQAYYGDDYYSSITLSAWDTSTYNKPYTQKDLDEHVQVIKNVYNESSTSTLTGITGSMVEINGVLGYRLTYYTSVYGYSYGHDIYELRSDNYDFTIEIE